MDAADVFAFGNSFFTAASISSLDFLAMSMRLTTPPIPRIPFGGFGAPIFPLDFFGAGFAAAFAFFFDGFAAFFGAAAAFAFFLGGFAASGFSAGLSSGFCVAACGFCSAAGAASGFFSGCYCCCSWVCIAFLSLVRASHLVPVPLHRRARGSRVRVLLLHQLQNLLVGLALLYEVFAHGAD